MSTVTDPLVVNELQRIADAHAGILRAEDVVEAAKGQHSPLHSRFEWNDSEAAHQYRLEQARRLIRVTVQVIPGTSVESRVFVSLSSDRETAGGGYRSAVAVLSDSGMRQKLLDDAIDELERFQQKFRSLEELSRVFEAANEVRQSLLGEGAPGAGVAEFGT